MRKRSKSNLSQHRWLVENLMPVDVVWEIVDTMPSSKGEGVRVGRLGGLIGSRQLGKGPLRDKRLARRRGKLIDSHTDRMHRMRDAEKLEDVNARSMEADHTGQRANRPGGCMDLVDWNREGVLR